jgi:hypothetical protein
MARLAQHLPNEREELLVAVAVLGIIGVVLIVFAPARAVVEPAPAVASAQPIKFPSTG